MWFTSDNAAPAAPEVMAALLRANEGPAMAYGADRETERARAMVREALGAPEAAVHFLATGTAANALALAALCPPWGAVFCHDEAHVECDECGAPEFFTGGAKLVRVPGADGRIDGAALAEAVERVGGPVHHVQRGALSITQATEAGTVYSVAELAALSGAARGVGIPVHLDGTRLANALAATGESPAAMTWEAGVDVLSLGFTKNGAVAAEAVVLFDDRLAWEFELRRKRGGHLFSKMRFVAAQVAALLEDGLWLRLAARANARAAALGAGVAAAGGRLVHPVEANIVFADLPAGAHRALRAKGATFHDMPGAPEGHVRVRLVCSGATDEAEVEAFVAALRAG